MDPEKKVWTLFSLLNMDPQKFKRLAIGQVRLFMKVKRSVFFIACWWQSTGHGHRNTSPSLQVCVFFVSRDPSLLRCQSMMQELHPPNLKVGRWKWRFPEPSAGFMILFEGVLDTEIHETTQGTNLKAPKNSKKATVYHCSASTLLITGFLGPPCRINGNSILLPIWMLDVY